MKSIWQSTAMWFIPVNLQPRNHVDQSKRSPNRLCQGAGVGCMAAMSSARAQLQILGAAAVIFFASDKNTPGHPDPSARPGKKFTSPGSASSKSRNILPSHHPFQAPPTLLHRQRNIRPVQVHPWFTMAASVARLAMSTSTEIGQSLSGIFGCISLVAWICLLV